MAQVAFAVWAKKNLAMREICVDYNLYFR